MRPVITDILVPIVAKLSDNSRGTKHFFFVPKQLKMDLQKRFKARFIDTGVLECEFFNWN